MKVSMLLPTTQTETDKKGAEISHKHCKGKSEDCEKKDPIVDVASMRILLLSKLARKTCRAQ